MVQVSCQYHLWFWSYDNFLLLGIDQKSGNWKCPFWVFWVLLNISRLRQVRDTKLGMNVSIKILLNAAKCHGYSLYHFWVIKGKPTGEGGGRVNPHPTAPSRLGLRLMEFQVRYLALFLLFSVTDGFKWFWMEVLTRISS